MSEKTVGVIGGGAWGTGLAQALARGGHKVQIWAFEKKLQILLIMSTRISSFFQVILCMKTLLVRMILKK